MMNKRFENRLNKNNIKFNTLNPVWDYETMDAYNVFKMIAIMNKLNDEYQELTEEYEYLEGMFFKLLEEYTMKGYSFKYP